ncbi:MAG TPA: hypothetical protein PKE27_00055 [Povalibacter sp.]|uniref:hypothetical protein n=1 Tax=Povalibacter sp. TaxID=1962978 RepID=UPI002CE0E049|nr:hypothetical protein [Povalibacter sp.]HMN42938.1 hypothetical protein [Povalibacter sp.]
MPLVDPFDQPADAMGSPLGLRAAGNQASEYGVLDDPFDEPEPDYSQLGEFDADGAPELAKWRLALGYLTSPNDEARADIIRTVLPDATVIRDSSGAPIISYKGKMGYVNKPGASLRDVLGVGEGIAKYLPAGRTASLARPLLGKVALMGAASGATSVAEDIAAIPQGSQQGIDPVRAGVTGVAGAAGQAMAPVLARWLQSAGTSVKRAWDALRPHVRGESITEQGRAAARQLGLKVDQITPQLLRELSRAADDAANAGVGVHSVPGVADRLALSRRFGVPLTKGELTDDYAQQSLEENLRRMDVTTKAGNIMRSQGETADAALRGANNETGFGLVKREIAGNTPLAGDTADAGQALLSATRRAADKAQGAYREAYATAREAGSALNSTSYRSFLDGVEAKLKNSIDYDPALFPKTATLLDNLRARQEWMVAVAERGQTPGNIPLSKLENLRKLMNAQWRSADATDRMGLDVLRREFDEMVNGAIDSGKVTGDKVAVEAWKRGRDLYARFRDLYSPGRAEGLAERRAGRTVQDWLKSESATGEQVIKSAAFNSALAKRIVQIHGEDSPAHKALKQGMLEYVFRPALKDNGVSPRMFKSRYEQFFIKQYRENMQAVFSPQDMATLNEFYRLVLAKVPKEGVVNYSNTGNVLMKGLQQLGQKLGVAMVASGNLETAAAMQGINAAAQAGSASQARQAVRGLLPVNRSLPYVAAGAVGGSEPARR